MQTFFPYPEFESSAKVLDRQRLGKQRVECKQILLALENPDYGWQNHPATNMWRGHNEALALYGVDICEEWLRRGYKDSLLPFFKDRTSSVLKFPSWIGNGEFHRSHRSNLLRKDPKHYRAYWPSEADDIPYVWPV